MPLPFPAIALLLMGPEGAQPPPSVNHEGWYYQTLQGRRYWCSGTKWIQVSPGYYRVETPAELPLTGLVEGDLGYVAGTTHRLYFWDGSDWRQIRY